MTTVASMLVKALADASTTWGVVGDDLNPVTDTLRRESRIAWAGVRHEEAGAFAAGAQAQLTGRIGVCMGTAGPGSIHLLNGLYDARKSHASIPAICGQVPSAELGSDYFQEVDNDAAFREVAVFCRTVTDPAQLPDLLAPAVNTAYARGGVAVLPLPDDVGGRNLPNGTREPRFVEQHPPAAPIVLTLKGKEGLEQDNIFQIGQTGLLAFQGMIGDVGNEPEPTGIVRTGRDDCPADRRGADPDVA